jgi:hypothetical protein
LVTGARWRVGCSSEGESGVFYLDPHRYETFDDAVEGLIGALFTSAAFARKAGSSAEVRALKQMMTHMTHIKGRTPQSVEFTVKGVEYWLRAVH